MNSQALKQFDAYIRQNYSGILSISPVNSTTPFEVEHALTGAKEFLFIAKCDAYTYKPLKGRDIGKPLDIKFTLYNEGNNLIVRFDLLDIFLESEIPASGAKKFLSILLHQETITLVVVDSNTYQTIWLTNTIPFRKIRFHYKEIFEKYDVI